MNFLETLGLSSLVYILAGSVVAAAIGGAGDEGDPPIIRWVCVYVGIVCWPVFVLELFVPEVEEFFSGSDDDFSV